MSFLDEVDTLKSKLHLREIPLPLRIGLIVVGVAILFILFQGLWELGAENKHLNEGTSQSSSEESSGVEIISSNSKDDDANAAHQTISVHVVGSVVNPGLYEVEKGSRIKEVIDAASGFKDDAEQSSVNLARVVEDGEQIVVQSKNASPQASSSASSSSSAVSSSNSTGSSTGAGLVNINTADAQTLMSLSGVGESTAKKIIADREKNGPFKTKKDITRVSGIGEKKYEAIKDSITV